jgi:hypothetical protein
MSPGGPEERLIVHVGVLEDQLHGDQTCQRGRCHRVDAHTISGAVPARLVSRRGEASGYRVHRRMTANYSPMIDTM